MEKTYTKGLIIDGTAYNIPMVSISRNMDFLEKYAQRTEDGDIKLETIGLYKNYTINIGVIEDYDLYDALIDQITDCTNRFHTVVLPDATKDFSFCGYFSSISDQVEKILDEGTRFTGLTWTMTSKKPSKTP